MSLDLRTELAAVCRVASERRAALLGEVRKMAALWLRVHTAIGRDDWAEYDAAVGDMITVKLAIASLRGQLHQALKFEARLNDRAIDWALLATGDAGEDEPQTLEGVHHGR
jgi:hypothetical protein